MVHYMIAPNNFYSYLYYIILLLKKQIYPGKLECVIEYGIIIESMFVEREVKKWQIELVLFMIIV